MQSSYPVKANTGGPNLNQTEREDTTLSPLKIQIKTKGRNQNTRASSYHQKVVSLSSAESPTNDPSLNSKTLMPLSLIRHSGEKPLAAGVVTSKLSMLDDHTCQFYDLDVPLNFI